MNLLINEEELLGDMMIAEDSIVEIPGQHPDTNSSWHLYIIRLKRIKILLIDSYLKNLETSGILVNIHYIPIYRQPYYQKLGFSIQSFEKARELL